MSNKFKQQAAAQRAAVPQIDLEQSPPHVEPTTPTMGTELPAAPFTSEARLAEQPTVREPMVKLTPVDTSERPVSHGFQMYPSRHRQLAKDLAYIEDRNPWLIMDDALEEYVIRHYGKQYRRR